MTSDSRFSNLIIYTDGSLTPEGAGAGVVVLDAIGQLLHLENQRLDTPTNNEAEYAAVALALQIATRIEADIVEIRADSEVMVNQMLGKFAVNSHRLKKYHWQVCELARNFPRVRYTRINREENALADTLASEASAGRIWVLGVV
jgi:probable phosphoglycerate mutase